MTRESLSPLHAIRRRSPGEKPGLDTLPYDLLLNVASYLQLNDVHSLHLTCKSLHEFSKARPVYRRFATDLLRRCRALPLKGFQQLTDLTTDHLVRSVNRATRYDEAWRLRAPRPISSPTSSNYMDGEPPTSTKWYKIVSAPPNDEVDWLSPITSSYTLCATKKGKVVCWDVQTDRCLAEWNPGEKWELWKCRVEFDQRTVYFTMAKVLAGSYSDTRVMKFVLMKLTFSDGPTGATCHDPPPVFSHVTDFRTSGVVMNVFLLDPTSRLLSAFIWVASSNTIGLYVLLDWDRPREYVFVDTGIECINSSNWSCILYDPTQSIVIHSEESHTASQHFYPLSLLHAYLKTLPRKNAVPQLVGRLRPERTLTKRFRFPVIERRRGRGRELGMEPTLILGSPLPQPYAQQQPQPQQPPQYVNGNHHQNQQHGNQQTNNPNPYPIPPWYPESAHFVRQWWPTLVGVPKVSCTVVLLAALEEEVGFAGSSYFSDSEDSDEDDDDDEDSDEEDEEEYGEEYGEDGDDGEDGDEDREEREEREDRGGKTKFVLVQHYFRVPISHRAWMHDRDVCPRKHLRRRRFGASSTSTFSSGSTIPTSTPSSSTATTNGYTNGPSNGSPPNAHEEDDTEEDTEEEDEQDLYSNCGCDPSTLTDAQRALVSQDERLMDMWYVSRPFEVVRVLDGVSSSGGSSGSGGSGSSSGGSSTGSEGSGEGEGGSGEGASGRGRGYLYGGSEQDEYSFPSPDGQNQEDDEDQEDQEDQEEQEEEQEEEEGTNERPRPLVAVDFGHAVWVERYVPRRRRRRETSTRTRTRTRGEGSGLGRKEGEGSTRTEEMKQKQKQRKRTKARSRRRRTYGMDVLDDEGGDTDLEEDAVRHALEEDHEREEGTQEEESGETAKRKRRKGRRKRMNDGLRLRFVTFPRFRDEFECGEEGEGEGVGKGKGKESFTSPPTTSSSSSTTSPFTPSSNSNSTSTKNTTRNTKPNTNTKESQGTPRTLKIPKDLNLASVETINIDQSQGAVILSDRERRIWILCYE